mmetsp:Transcript_71319/g.130185  ORF Transcript_71319/g.130185 Transcript_71319/m.130185 type:complete len:84 (+) Transcript_71319:153-404(+)
MCPEAGSLSEPPERQALLPTERGKRAYQKLQQQLYPMTWIFSANAHPSGDTPCPGYMERNLSLTKAALPHAEDIHEARAPGWC